MNLAQNAVEHTEVGDEIGIGTAVTGTRRRSGSATPAPGSRSRAAENLLTVLARGPRRGRYEGTGIGLAIVRAIAEAHGGRVRVTSVPARARGSRSSLPIEPGCSGGGLDRGGRGVKRILIVEDEAGDVELHREGPRLARVRDQGVRRRRDGDRDRVATEDFDLVILDLGLPDVGRPQRPARDPAPGASACR